MKKESETPDPTDDRARLEKEKLRVGDQLASIQGEVAAAEQRRATVDAKRPLPAITCRQPSRTTRSTASPPASRFLHKL